MEIAVKEFSGYSSFDNNHIYDLVVSIRIMKTATNTRTPDTIVIAGVQHMLERALVLQGLTLLGYPSAAAFEVVVEHVGGLIDITREENREKLDAVKLELDRAVNQITVLKREFAATMGSLMSAKDDIENLREENVALRDEINALLVKLGERA